VTSDEANERRLAVILAADVASYSRLMSQDEEATLITLAVVSEFENEPG
jgi:adenylate cyclase